MTDDTWSLPGESWRAVVGLEGLYEVSDAGRVRNLRTLRRGGVMKLSVGTDGYLAVGLTRDGRQTTYRVHKLVAAAFIGPCPEGQEVRHWDGDRANAALSNLLYGTRAENIADQRRHGTSYWYDRTHCLRGHEYTPANTRWYKGRRFCKRCALLRCWKQRGKELPPEMPAGA